MKQASSNIRVTAELKLLVNACIFIKIDNLSQRLCKLLDHRRQKDSSEKLSLPVRR